MTRSAFLIAAVCAFASGGLRPPLAGAAEFSAKQLEFYEKEVKPLLAAHCMKCHGAEEKLKGGLSLKTRAAVLAGGDTGPAFDPKAPSASLLVKAVEYKDENLKMPPKGRLTDKDAAVLAKWAADGLAMPAGDRQAAVPEPKAHPKGGVVTAEAKRYWAYQPVRQPAVPVVKAKEWVKSPVDAFVLARLEARGLSPVGPAGRVALARRAYYDLLGLPPTPEQVDAFVNDPSPDAWEKLIDALLGVAALRREVGPALARRGPVRRDQRVRAGRRQAVRLEVPRLRHPQLQRGQAVRPVRDRAGGRGRAARPRRRGRRRHRVLPARARGTTSRPTASRRCSTGTTTW